MADRSYIIEVLLQARDDTARAFASAAGKMEAYDALLDEQKKKTDAQVDANGRLIRSNESIADVHGKVAQGVKKVVDAQARYQQSSDRLAKTQREYQEGDLVRAKRLAEARAKLISAEKNLHKVITDTGQSKKKFDTEASLEAAKAFRAETRKNSLYREQVQILGQLEAHTKRLGQATDAGEIRRIETGIRSLRREMSALGADSGNISRAFDDAFSVAKARQFEAAQGRVNKAMDDYRKLVEQVAQAEEKRETTLNNLNRRQGVTQQQHDVVRQSLDINVTRARARLDEFRASERTHAVNIPIHADERSIADARLRIATLRATSGHEPAASGGGGGALDFLSGIQKRFADLDTSTGGFVGKLRNSFGFSLVTLIQPLAALIIGLVGTFGALASAAVAAGSALGITFASAVAQGIPVVGLLAAAMSRLQSIFQYVTTAQQQVQQRFIAGYQAAYQNALGINQVVIAQHNYRDSLIALQNSVQAVTVAEFNLRATRQQATRQLQDLILQERQAKLAAEASSLAVADSEKALRAAVATGGDIQGAQLSLSQAQVSHVQATRQAHRAIADASQGSIARQSIDQQVTQAQRAVQQARVSVTDAQFAATQARASIIQARQAAAGYNVGVAAQLAFLRSQMTETEKSLADNIQKIYSLFQGVHGRLRPVTDAILSAFVPLTSRLYQILTDPKFFGALLNLGRSIGGAIRQISNTLFNRASIQGFIDLINAAAANMRPLANIVSGFFRGMGGLVRAAIPFVHQFLGFISQIADKFGAWASSARGQNWLKDFFDIAFRSLRTFVNLALSIGKLILAIVGVGGGAKTGIGLLQDLQGWVDRTTNSINSHGRAFRTLHTLWATARPTLHVLGEVLGAVVSGLLKLGGSRAGQRSLQGLGDIVAHILVPAFVQFAINIGRVVNRLLDFLSHHPGLQRMLVQFIALAATASIGMKAIGLVFGPLAALLGPLGAIIKLAKALPAIFAADEAAGVAAFLAPLAPVALLVAAIVGIAAATGNLGNLAKTVAAPFVAAWGKIKKPLDDLGKQFLYFVNQILAPFGLHVKGLGQLFHNAFAGILAVVKFIFTQIGNVVGGVIGGIFKSLAGFFELFGGLISGNGHKIVEGFKKIGQGMLQGLTSTLLFLPKLLVNLFIKMIDAVLKWLGISSPSRRMASIGRDMLNGLWNALAGIVHLGAKLVGWAASGIGHLIGWMLGLGERLLKAIWRGLVAGVSLYWNLQKFIWGHIFNAIFSILKDIERLGEKIIGALINGIKKAGSKVGHAISSVIPQPIKDAANFAGQALPWNWNKGGAVPGYGGGDIVSSNLEPGEHVLTKEEVSKAGGHGAIFALRRLLGGGTQGGPGGYATGGVVRGQGQTVQGVTGQLGNQLGNILNFRKEFIDDWRTMWLYIQKLTTDNVQKQQNGFTKLQNSVKDIWNNINQTTNDSLQKMHDNLKRAFTRLDNNVFNAFWYVQHAANVSLRSFGAKPVDVHLGPIPKFSEGGVVGNWGERGRDGVHALLGRGEAVLNWAHQAMVEPAMRAYYGFGLDKMFNKVHGLHGGQKTEGGYAAGGPVNWYGKASNVSPFLAQLVALMERQWPGLVVTSTRSGTHASGSYHYLGEAVDMASGNYGYMNRAAQWIVNSGLYKSLTEGIHNPGLSVKFGKSVAPSFWGATTWAEHANHIHMAITNAIGRIASSKAIAGALGGAGANLGPSIQNIAEIPVRGTGPMRDLLTHAIRRITSAANNFIGTQSGGAGGGGAFGATPVSTPGGPAIAKRWTEAAMRLAGVSGRLWENVLLRQESRESSYNPNAINRWDINAQRGDPSRGILQLIGSNFAKYAIRGYNKNIFDPISNIIAAIRYMIDTYGHGNAGRAVQVMAARGGGAYAGGGWVGGARNIIGHVGEWVVNKAQQSKIAGRLGTTVGNLKDSLGFSGGPHSFAGGGVIGDLPVATKTGQYTDPAGISLDTPGFTTASIGIYNKAQDIVARKIEQNGRKIGKGIQQFLSNFNAIGGDNGLFALAAQAIDNFATRQQTLVSLAAAGVRVINGRLRFGVAQTALQAATSDLIATNRQVTALESLRHQEASALAAINTQLRRLGRPRASNLKLYQQLVGARQQLVNNINDTDTKLAQGITDQYTKAQAIFQAQLNQTLRGRGTLGVRDIGRLVSGGSLVGILRRVGPGIASGIASMAQSIAQTLGDPRKIAGADQAVLVAARGQQHALQDAYNKAAARARRDPRWQSVADDLLSQLESATVNVAQAQAQALTDAISAQDTASQRQLAALALRDRISAVQVGFGNVFGAARGQIATSQARSGTLSRQIGAYQGLLDKATAEGNTAAVNTLTDQIADLRIQVQEANLQTQQLITAYHQLSVSIIQNVSQSSSGFFQAAKGITQTLGAISGSLNLPELINFARQSGQNLIDQGQIIIKTILDTISDPSNPFGGNQGAAGGYLSSLVAAYNQGPQAFANTLAALAPGLSTFMANLPQDQQTLFQGLVQALTDNTTSIVGNTQELQQLNATTNQQQFTSTAWTMFRQAIFTGLGGLLPQYAMHVPSMDVGGMITRSGLIYGHTDEMILPASVSRNNNTGPGKTEHHFHITSPTEVADPVYLSNEIAFKISHNPNAR